jgi:hypothetical protein
MDREVSEMSENTMRLTHAEYDATRDKIEKLNKRAVKRGWTGRITITGEPVTVKETGPSGLPITKQLIDTTITGEPPKYDGWTFLARLEWDKDSGLVVFTAPGVPEIDRSGLREGACDHCETARYRRNVFLVADENGTTQQVGSTCIKDFLGWDFSPVWISTSISDYEEMFEGGYGHTEPTYSTETVLAAAWAVIQEFGYVRSDDWSNTPTKSTVAAVLDPRSNAERKLAKLIAPHISEAVKQANVIREWVLSDAFKGHSDYVTNLKNIAAGEFVRTKNFGFLVSAPQTWAKSIERDLIRRAEKADIVNEYTGAIGDRLELEVKVKAIRYIDGDWGTTSLYTLEGKDHRLYKWFSSCNVWSETSDEYVTIKGTVKKHNEFHGTKSTVLTRVKVVS